MDRIRGKMIMACLESKGFFSHRIDGIHWTTISYVVRCLLLYYLTCIYLFWAGLTANLSY